MLMPSPSSRIARPSCAISRRSPSVVRPGGRLVFRRTLGRQRVLLTHEPAVVVGDIDQYSPAGAERVRNDPAVADRDSDVQLRIANAETERRALLTNRAVEHRTGEDVLAPVPGTVGKRRPGQLVET